MSESNTQITYHLDCAPIGFVVQIGSATPEQRIAKSDFNRYLFQYFEEISSGQTGWGVDFNAWLEMRKGWKHHGSKKYERIMSIEEMIEPDPDWMPIASAPTDGTRIQVWDGEPVAVYWNQRRKMWIEDKTGCCLTVPVAAWMPLPPPTP